MRLGLAAALTVLALTAIQGCSQPQPTKVETATIQVPTPASVPSLTSLPTRIPTPILISTSTPVPPPTATVPPTAELVNDPTPKELLLTIEPAEPFSGRDARFTLSGLNPWERITVQFFDPVGKPAEWVTEYESYLNDADKNPVSERRQYADGHGLASWLRIGTKDQAGIWKVQITRDGLTTDLTYTVNQLPVTPSGVKTLGVDFRLYQGPGSNTYYTDKVPGALTVDLQNHLRSVTSDLREVSGLHGKRTPNIYLVDTLDLLKQVSESTGSSLGFADGYFHSGADDSGIYMHTDALLTSIQRLLTHEYVHLALHATIGPSELPAWLNEGTATFFEYQLNLEGERADATRHSYYRSIGLAENAASSGGLLSLTGLESQETWNNQTEKSRIDLQYAQSHMAVRYLADAYKGTAPIDIMKRMGTGATLSEAFVEIVGVQYSTFEERFAGWLQSWEDPKRSQVSGYIPALGKLMDAISAISDRREEDLASGLPSGERVATKKALLSDAEELLIQVGNLSPPPELNPLQDESVRFVERFIDLLSLESENQIDQSYLNSISEAIRAIDTISKRRISDVQNGVPAVERIQNNKELSSDAQEALKRLVSTAPPSRLEPLHPQGLAFLEQYKNLLDTDVEFLAAQLTSDQESDYLQSLFDIVDSMDRISVRRSEALQSGGPVDQRIAASQGLVSDAESLIRQLDSIELIPTMVGLYGSGKTYLNLYARWLTLELESIQSEESSKLDEANAMVSEINTGRQNLVSKIISASENQPSPEELNRLIGEISRMNNVLVEAINAEFKGTPSFHQSKVALVEVIARQDRVTQAISDLEFIYNLQEP